VCLFFFHSSEVSRGSAGQEGGLEARIRCAMNAMRQRELELGRQELLDVRTSDTGVSESSHLDDLDAAEASAMAGSHVLIELVDSADTRDIAELFVDVVRASAAVVATQNAKVLHLCRLLLVNLDDREDLSSRCLHLLGT